MVFVFIVYDFCVCFLACFLYVCRSIWVCGCWFGFWWGWVYCVGCGDCLETDNIAIFKIWVCRTPKYKTNVTQPQPKTFQPNPPYHPTPPLHPHDHPAYNIEQPITKSTPTNKHRHNSNNNHSNISNISKSNISKSVF